MQFKIFTTLFVLFLVGCSTTNNNSGVITAFKPELKEDKKLLRVSFIGKWFSEQETKDGGFRRTTIERMPDSRYLVTFDIFDAEKKLIMNKKEFGYWGVSGGIYFTMYRGWIDQDRLFNVDPSDAYNYDTYKILSTSSDLLNYQSLSSGNLYTYSRVNTDTGTGSAPSKAGE